MPFTVEAAESPLTRGKAGVHHARNDIGSDTSYRNSIVFVWLFSACAAQASIGFLVKKENPKP